MKTLFPFLKPYRKECVLAPLFKLLEALLELFVPLLMAAIIDKGIMASDSGYVLRTGLVLVGLGLLGFGASATAQYFAARAATGFSADVKSSLFAHIQRFSYADLDRLGSSTLINRMTTDVNQMQTGVNMVLRLLLRSPFVVFGATIMAFTVNARAALIFLALLPLLTLTVVGITKLTLPRYQRVQGQLDKVLLHTRENVTGVRVLRAFRMQQAETAAYKSDNDELTRMQLRVGRLSALMNPLTFILVNAALIVLLGSALAVALAAWISGLLTRPLRQLSAAAARLARGEYDAPLPTAQNDEIGALIRAFSGMSGAIGEREAALRAQAEERQALIDALAHEMRTPLTAILGGARLLGQSKLSEGQQSELLDMMAREAARLSTMDERLLLLTRLGHEQPEWTTFDSRAMAEEALRVFDGVRLEGEGAAFVGERELTILLLRNLVVNAQRAGGETPVCVTLHPDGFDVTDCGCGMTEEQLAHAFEPFYKADKARTRGAGGAGLGLSLCRKIARLHRGDVRIESEIGKGTRVCYRFDTSL